VSAPYLHEAYEELLGAADAPLVLSCEHASERLPGPWSWHADDHWLAGTHWAYDLGARALTLELAAALRASAVLSRFTRLLVDPNRELSHPDLFRAVAEGRQVRLNQALDAQQRALRIAQYYQPFHAALDQAIARSRAPLLLSIHSFTPNYQGEVRDVELGVLFNREEAHGRALRDALASQFAAVAENEPWSGKQGLIFSAESHAERFGRVALELEVRQDRLEDATYRARLVPALAEFVRARFSVR
jgi:predicted N-formylglutamate amidohydrolase